MEVYIYDTALNLKGTIDAMTSFVWTRRYWKPGDFKLLVPFTALNASLLIKGALIMRKGDEEAGQIKYRHISTDVYGMENIEVQGSFITSWLGKRIILNQINATDNSQNLLNRIVTENITNPADSKRIIPALELEADQPELGSGNINYASESHISAIYAAEALAKAAKLGFKLSADYKNKKYIFKVFKGRELTADQQENPSCVFSPEFDNVYEQEFTESTENYKNYAYVGGEEKENAARVIVEVGSAEGLERDEVFITASDISQTYKQGDADITMPLETYQQLLTERGESDLNNYEESLSFSSRVNAFSSLVYRKDYDVGDRVSCVNKAWGIRINVRITEIMETYEKTKTDMFITFGESLPTLLNKLKIAG